MRNHTRVALAATLLFAIQQLSAALIIQEDFGGSGAVLNGTTANIFDAGLIGAGGSANWIADGDFDDNGAFSSSGSRTAYLNLGMYLENTKGTPTGLFELTISGLTVTGGQWFSMGYNDTAPGLTQDFTNFTGLGTIIKEGPAQAPNTSRGWLGPGTASFVFDTNPMTVGTTLTTVLDLRTYDGIGDFGSVSFYDGTSSGTLLGTGAFSNAQVFRYLALSLPSTGSTGTIGSLTLSQANPVPEASTLLLSLGIFGVLAFCARSTKLRVGR